MLQIAICEDNICFLNQLIASIETILAKNNIDGKVVYTTGSASELESNITTCKANTYFLDIELGNEYNGYMLAEKIRKKDMHSYIVFVSGHFEYILEAFKVQSFDFLLKPLNNEVLEQCLIRINKYQMVLANMHNHIEVKSGSSIYKVNIDNIVYIERLRRDTIIYSKNGMITCRETLESLEKALGNGNFVRCHKSFIANKALISEIHYKDKTIFFETGHKCYFGRKYKDNVTL